MRKQRFNQHIDNCAIALVNIINADNVDSETALWEKYNSQCEFYMRERDAAAPTKYSLSEAHFALLVRERARQLCG